MLTCVWTAEFHSLPSLLGHTTVAEFMTSTFRPGDLLPRWERVTLVVPICGQGPGSSSTSTSQSPGVWRLTSSMPRPTMTQTSKASSLKTWLTGRSSRHKA